MSSPQDGAALVAAAVQAAIRERAPRRTVAAVAAAVAGTVLSAAARPAGPATLPKVRTQDAQSNAGDSDDPVQLLEKLRAVRRAQRARRNQKRREAKQAALDSHRPSLSEPQPGADVSRDDGTAGQSAEPGGALAAVPAPVPQLPVANSPLQPGGDLSQQLASGEALLSGLVLQQLPTSAAETALDDLSECSHASTMRPPASDTASAGMPRHGRHATSHRHMPYHGGTPTVPGRQ
jgi:hypothetical protein